MIPGAGDDKKKAFTLHEQGWYQDSFDLCTRILTKEKDPSLEVLAATNLFFLKRYDDAETYFHDLIRKMPDSSYLHSYLAKVLAAKSDDAARGEYAAAVRLDPGNQDALRSYAGFLLETGDIRGAIPVFRRLESISPKKDDASLLIHALVQCREFDEAIRTHAARLEETSITPEYLDALLALGHVEKVVEGGARSLREKQNPAILQRYLLALAKTDPDAAAEKYREAAAAKRESPEILSDYLKFLVSRGELDSALQIAKNVSGSSHEIRFSEAEILEKLGKQESALAEYQEIFQRELDEKSDPRVLEETIRRFREFLDRRYPGKVKELLIDPISSDPGEVCLVTTGRYYEEAGKREDARSWYYRAFRSDFLSGGIEYVQYLLRVGDYRECEKTLLYIIANVKKIADLERVTGIVVADAGTGSKMKRLIPSLLATLEARRMALRYEGLEYLALLYHRAAKAALDNGDTLSCKENCLRGIDAIPPGSHAVRLEDFTVLLRVCKERILIDTPVLPSASRPVSPGKTVTTTPVAIPDEKPVEDDIELDETERAALVFLRAHHTASEMELRAALNTRRVAGIMNRLIRKMQEKGRIGIEKRGVGEQGEVYHYAGDA